jgi:hypothetical protein
MRMKVVKGTPALPFWQFALTFFVVAIIVLACNVVQSAPLVVQAPGVSVTVSSPPVPIVAYPWRSWWTAPPAYPYGRTSVVVRPRGRVRVRVR